MSEQANPLENPFSKENALLTFRKNMATASRLREEASRGDSGESTRERLLKAVEALGRFTDNTILLKIVREALEARDSA